MEHLQEYVAGLVQVIKAGIDVRTIINGELLPVIDIVIDEEKKDLTVTYLHRATLFDKHTHVPASAMFTAEFNDFPDELREADWQ